MNKCDKLQNAYDMPVIGKTVMISAVKNEGIDRLLEVIEDSLPKTKARAILLVPFSEGHILGEIRKRESCIPKAIRRTERGWTPLSILIISKNQALYSVNVKT